MKAKITGLIILISLLASVSEAQVLIGPIAGGNFSWTSFGDKDFKDDFKVSPVFGWHAGGHVSFRVRKRFFLHTSLIYSTKGKDMEGKSELFDDLTLKMRYKYIEMPIVYTVNFRGTINKKPFKYFLGIGPNVSYWLGGKGTIVNTDTHEFAENGPEVDFKISFKGDPVETADDEMVVEKPTRIQLGLNFTTGFVFEPARDREMVLTFRYELGHSYLSRESNGVFGQYITYYEDNLKTRNMGLRVSLAYMIDLKVDQRKKGKTTFDKKKF
ncbi:outer membrane beta-barrel protein [Pseudochryseolinea flava]|uniref:outer membrane beta-barrel protein n=1 Tax=Pseudochryseolinea flava TaxID=2059302 RepID=UPI001402E8AB|nr:outer membrane beta-barrel protein [Pseudochryseolinea flava]